MDESTRLSTKLTLRSGCRESRGGGHPAPPAAAAVRRGFWRNSEGTTGTGATCGSWRCLLRTSGRRPRASCSVELDVDKPREAKYEWHESLSDEVEREASSEVWEAESNPDHMEEEEAEAEEAMDEL